MSQVLELKRELESRRRQIVRLEQELRDRDNRIIELEQSSRKFLEENRQAHKTMLDIEQLVEERTQKAIAVEQEKLRKTIDDLKNQNDRYKTDIQKLEVNQKKLEEKDDEVAFLQRKLQDLSDARGMSNYMGEVKAEKTENTSLKRELERVTKEWTTLSGQMEEVLSENKVLREMAGVPENYGFNLKEIRLTEQQKIEEYKGRVMRLEEEVEELEKDRADLRYRLRNLSTLYGEKGVRFHNLTAEQMKKVDEFAQNLREGRLELPLNDRSRELLREVEKLKAQIEILQNHSWGHPGKQVPDNLIEQIRNENKEVKDLLVKLHSGFKTTSEEDQKVARHALQLPPVPVKDSQGEYSEGYSYRFGSSLPVSQIWTGDSKRDLSALQLQVVELVELLNRRDENEKLTSFELEEFRNKLREILLVQEQLYKEYSKKVTNWDEYKRSIEDQYENAMQELREARAQVSVYEDMAKTIQANNPKTEKAKVAELSSKIALHEVNNLRLSRKYDCLQAEERDLRQSYHKLEAEHSEKDVLVQKRLGKLREWRVSATYQLQFLFKQLRQSVPNDHFEGVSQQLELLREKQADWLVREANLYKRLSKFENLERENHDLKESAKNQEELNYELETELASVSRRLEGVDPDFRLEQAAIKKLVHNIKSRYLSPQSTFAMIDKNKDGKLTRGEFTSALNSMGIKLQPVEVESLMRSIGVDIEGNIKYPEFLRKLQVYGVKNLSEEQQLVQYIYDSIKKLNYTLYDVFTIFDRDGDGKISRQDLIDSFHNFGLGISTKQVENFLRLIDTDRDGLIEYPEFKRVFEREIEIQSKEGLKIDWKDELISKVNEAMRANGITINEAFSAFDSDKDGKISKSEFGRAFSSMGATLSMPQLEELWNSMNTNSDGSISYYEFISKFKTSVREKETADIIREAEQSYGVARVTYDHDRDRRQVAVLEAREKAALSKCERYQQRMKNLEDMLSETEKELNQLESNHLELTKKYHISREEEVYLRNQLSNTVSKSEAERLRQHNETLQQEVAECRAAMQTYKNLVTVSSDHARALQLTIERRKDEVHMFQQAIRELQANSQDSATVGKLYHQLMVARWSEASSNRKYDSLLNETRNLRTESFRLENECMEREKSLFDVQQILTEKISSYEARIKDLKLRAEHNISIEKANELVAQIRQAGEKKSELEDMNRKLRSKVQEIEGQTEEAKVMKEAAEELYQLMRTGSQDELSDKLVDMAEKMSGLRLGELKAKREMNQAKEKEEYLNRLHIQDQETLRHLEQEVAKWESILAKKEEAWRKKDDERQKLLLNPKFRPHVEVKQNVSSEDLNKKDEEISILKQQLQSAEHKISIKNEQIEHLTKLREDGQSAEPSKTVFGQEELMRIHDEHEADRLAQAANTTISTLQEMIDHKNSQLQRKDKTIEDLKNQVMEIQQSHAREVQKLQFEMEHRTEGISELKFELNPSKRTQHFKKPDLDSLLNHKDSRISQLAQQLKSTLTQKEKLETQLSQTKRELEEIKYQLNIESTKNTGEQYKKELENARKQITNKNKELNGLKKSLADLRTDLLNAAETNERNEKEMRERVLKEGSDNTVTIQNIKKAEQRIQVLTKQLKEAREEINKLKTDNIEARETQTKLKEENKRITDNQYKKQEMVTKLMKENSSLKKKSEETKKEPQDTQQLKNMQNTISKLESENSKLSKENNELKKKTKLKAKNKEKLKEAKSLSENYRQLQETLAKLEAENKNLKETNKERNQEISRFQRRVRDLENFKNKAVKDGFNAREEEIQTMKFAETTDIPESIRKDSEVQTLKNVVERLRAENEHLKRTSKPPTKQPDASQNEKVLQNKLQSLEQELKELRSRELINKDLELKMKKVNEANDYLRKEMEKEIHMVEEADNKYRALLLQHESLQKDHERLRKVLYELTQ